MKFKRVLLKLSGEALAGDKHTGYDMNVVSSICKEIKACADAGAQIGIVIGGGNFWRGVKDGAGKIERVSADRMGMLATCMNCLAVADVFRSIGAKVKLMTAFDIQGVGERYDALKARDYLDEGYILLFAGGTGMPFVSTDTASALRAAEIQAEAILLAKNIDGVYTADPLKDPTAVKYDKISYEEVLEKKLAVMDITATSMAMENKISAMVFALEDPKNILRALNGENVGTLVE